METVPQLPVPLLALALLAGACERPSSRPAPPADPPPTPVASRPAAAATREPAVERLTAVWRVDSAEVWPDENSVWRYRIAVARGGRTDTLPGVFTDAQMRVVGDTAVYGVALDSAGATRGSFRYTPRTGVELHPLPADLVYGLTTLDVAPDGQHVAYVAFDGAGYARGVVRRWPDGPEVATTTALPVPGGGALTGAAAWRSTREYVVYIDQAGSGARWTRVRGMLGQPATVIDTVSAAALAAEPQDDGQTDAEGAI